MARQGTRTKKSDLNHLGLGSELRSTARGTDAVELNAVLKGRLCLLPTIPRQRQRTAGGDGFRFNARQFAKVD